MKTAKFTFGLALGLAALTASTAVMANSSKCNPGAKCMDKDEVKIVDTMGVCVEKGKPSAGDHSANWFRKPTKEIQLSLASDNATNSYKVVADLRSRGVSVNEMPYSPPPGKIPPDEMLEGRQILLETLNPIPALDPTDKVILKSGDRKMKLTLVYSEKQPARIDASIMDKAPEGYKLYKGYLSYQIDGEQITFKEMKCAVDQEMLRRLPLKN